MTSAITTSGDGLSREPRTSPDLIPQQERSEGKPELTSKAIALAVQSTEGWLQLVHAMPGRIRLRTTDHSFNSVLEPLSKQLRQQDGIGEVSTNQETGSLLLRFNVDKLSLPQMFEILKQFGVLLPGALQSKEKTDPLAAWKSVDFWQEQGRSLIPLVTGLLVTGRLGLHGLSAIPAYLVAASATRQVLEYLESELTAPEANQTPQESQTVRKAPAVEETSESAEIAYSVVHAIPGRVRLHVPRIAQDRAYAQRLEMLLKADDQLKGYRVNRATATIVITYEPGLIPDAQMHSYSVALILLAGGVSQQAQPKTANGQATSESASPWAEFKHPALAASLAYMANLPV